MPEDTSPKTHLMVSMPGISRDGTQLSQKTYLDGEWCRWYQKLPRKIRGYREQLRNVEGIVRALDSFSDDGFSYVHSASGDAIQRYSIQNSTGLNSGLVDRTPAGYAPNPLYNWQFSQMFSVADTTTNIFASGTPNAEEISTELETPVYYGDILATAPLVAIPNQASGAPTVSSGGVVASGPFLFLYGHDGVVKWSMPGNPLDFEGVGSGDARPVADKIVRGMPLRGQTGPAVVLWSLSAVIVGNYVGGATVFDFTTITTSGSVLSSNGFVEHAGIYYWATSSGFAIFNGVVRDLPNEENKQWFLDNLNFAQRQKVFSFKIPRWNEIWWCFPKGSATECDHAVIFNYKDGFWYDTPLPNGGRSAGTYEMIFNYPIMAGIVANEDTSGGYSMWQHEFGFDEVSGAVASSKAIRSFYRTHEFNVVAAPAGQTGIDRSLSYGLLEPDFDQVGDIMFTAISRANARANEIVMSTVTIPEVPPASGNQLAKFRKAGRLTSFIIESNARGGNFITGSPVLHVQAGDGRRED
jgi:hypothetical protein